MLRVEVFQRGVDVRMETINEKGDYVDRIFFEVDHGTKRSVENGRELSDGVGDGVSVRPGITLMEIFDGLLRKVREIRAHLIKNGLEDRKTGDAEDGFINASDDELVVDGRGG
jgi:hypothetical protein